MDNLEEKLSITYISSDLSIPTIEEEKGAKKEDPLASNYPTWSTRIKCFQAYVCVIMNFLTILEFCLTVGNYGLVALIPSAIFKILIGVPAVLVELMLGRYIMGNITRSWKMCVFGKGVFYNSLGIIGCAIVCNYLLLSYLMKYVEASLHGFIPWEYCEGHWAKINCYESENNLTAFLRCVNKYSYSFCKNLTWESSGTQFWKNYGENSKELHSIVFSFLYLALGIILVSTIIFKGIRSCEKMFIILVYVPLILASIIAFGTFLIPGSAIGLKRIWFVDFSLLLDLKLWVIAFEDSLLSLTINMLPLIFISTHGKFLDDILIDLLVVFFSEIFCSFLMATPILSIIATKKFPLNGENKSRKNLFKDKVDVFILISEALLCYPYPKIMWAIGFYVEMILITTGNQVILVATLCEAIMGFSSDFINFFYISCSVGVISFFISTPFFFLSYQFTYPIATILITNVLLSVVTLEICYGLQRFNDDFYFMMGYPPSFFFRSGWFVSVATVLIILGLKIYFNIPDEPLKHIVFLYIAIPVIVYAIAASYEIYKASKKGKISNVLTANPDWGPDNALLRKSRIIFNSRAITKEFMYRQELYKKSFMKPPDFTEQNIVELI